MNRTGFSLALLRVVTGIIYIAHGWPKITGGVPATAAFFGQLGIPAPTAAAWFIALLESLGGLALLLGIFVTPVALLLAIHMLTGILLVHSKIGFYVLGPGQGGMEFNLILIAVLLTLVLQGPGSWAIRGQKPAVA
jgi:putative oxidoreductase